MDALTVVTAIFSFGIFLLVHAVTFRWVRPEHLLRSLFFAVLVILALPIVEIGIFYHLRIFPAPLMAWVCAAILASLLEGLMCFFYVLCIFGPYETSVRMRLVREIARARDQGISREELLRRYNTAIILDIRLKRLIGSGDIIERNGRYRIGNSKNFFFIFDAIASVIKKWVSPS